MNDEMWQLQQAAERWAEQAAVLRRKASMVRAAADFSWEGPGAASAREKAAQRWSSLLRLAEAMDTLADRLRLLAAELDAA